MDEPKADPKIVIRSRVPKFHVKFKVLSLKPSLESDMSKCFYIKQKCMWNPCENISQTKIISVSLLIKF